MFESKKWNIFFSIVLIIGLIYLLRPILTPFLLAAIFAYLGNPLVNLLMRCHLPRLLSVAIVFLLIFGLVIALVILLVPMIEQQIIVLVGMLPNVLAVLQNKFIPWLTATFGVAENFNIDSIKNGIAENWTKAGGVLTWLWLATIHSGFALIEFVVRVFLTPVVTFYLLRDWDKIIHNIRTLLPRPIESTVVKLAIECDSVLGAFFRGQLLVMFALGTVYSIGLSLVGLQIALLVGVIAGMVAIVPYLGFIVGVTIASVAAAVQFQDITHVLLVIAVFAVGQSLESMIFTPKFVGHRIGLHPVAVIFAVLTGGYLFGFFGVLLALPVAAIVMVVLRHMHHQYRQSEFYSNLVEK